MRRKKRITGAVAVVLVFALAYWFATGASPTREAPSWLTGQPIAHRGQWATGAERPENSLAAFDAAARSGNTVELDVQLTADGEVVVFHDADTERMTGHAGAVAEITLGELRELRLLGGTEAIPTLAEALSVIHGRVPVIVEIKNVGEVGALEDTVAAQLMTYEGEVAVMSFNPFSVARIAKRAPDIPRGQLAGGFEGENLPFYQAFLLRSMLMNWMSKPDFIAYEVAELPSRGTTIQRWLGRPLLGWTIEDMTQRVAAESLCDGVICNPGALDQPE